MMHVVSDTTKDRVPPHNPEAEMAVLGAILADNAVYENIADTLSPEHFADPANARIYAVCAEMIGANALAGPITLRSHFDADGTLEEIGDNAYLAKLAANIMMPSLAPDYARVIVEDWRRRELMEIGAELTGRAAEVEDGAQDTLEWAEERLYRMGRASAGRRDIQPFNVHGDAALADIEQAYNAGGVVKGLLTGFIDLDRRIQVGMRPGDLIIVAGRPSMGKTSLATNVAVALARSLKSVMFVSLEMPSIDIAKRVLGERAGISTSAFEAGEGTEDQFNRLFQANQELQTLSLHIDDQAGLSTTALRTRARCQQRGKGLDFLVVDYLQLLDPPDRKRRYVSPVDEVTQISRDLKAMAMDLEIPVMALSQLNRAVENRDDKRPTLRDLRESGAIEQDADQVWLIYRAEYYLRNMEPKREQFDDDERFGSAYTKWQKKIEAASNKAQIFIAKNRKGPSGSVDLHFDGALTRFTDLAHEEG